MGGGGEAAIVDEGCWGGTEEDGFVDGEGDLGYVVGASLGWEGGDEEAILSGGYGWTGEVYGREEELEVVFA